MKIINHELISQITIATAVGQPGDAETGQRKSGVPVDEEGIKEQEEVINITLNSNDPLLLCINNNALNLLCHQPIRHSHATTILHFHIAHMDLIRLRQTSNGIQHQQHQPHDQNWVKNLFNGGNGGELKWFIEKLIAFNCRLIEYT